MMSTWTHPIVLNDRFKVISYNGGHVTSTGDADSAYWVHNCLQTSDSIHLSQRSNADLVLFNPLPEDECFTLTHFIARAPDDSDVPLRSGYLWVSSEEPDLPAYADNFHDVPISSTMELSDRQDQQQPVLAFQLSRKKDRRDAYEVVHEFTEWPRGRYIHLRFLDAYRPDGERGSISVRYIGLIGFLGRGSKPGPLRPLPARWNVTKKPLSVCNVIHTDLADVLNEGPFVLVVSDSEADDRVKQYVALIQQVAADDAIRNRKPKLNFFLWTALDERLSRAEDRALFSSIEHDFKTKLCPPTAVLCNRPKGLFYHIGPEVPEITPSNLTTFCLAFLESIAKPWKWSAPTPGDTDRDPEFPATTLIVADSWERIVQDRSKDVLVFVHSSPRPYTRAEFEVDDTPLMDGLGPMGPSTPGQSTLYCIHKLAALLSGEDGLVVSHINAHENWVSKELAGDGGVLAVYPKNKFHARRQPAPQRRFARMSELLGFLLEAAVDHQSLKPLAQQLQAEEERRLFHRGPPQAQAPTALFNPAQDRIGNIETPLHPGPAELDIVSLPTEKTAAPQLPSFTFRMRPTFKVASKDGTPLRAAAWSTTTEYLAVGGEQGRIATFRIDGDPDAERPSDRSCHSFLEELSANVCIQQLDFGSGGNVLVALLSDGQVALWRRKGQLYWTEAGRIGRQESRCTSFRLSPDEHHVALSFADGYISVTRLPEVDTPRGGTAAVPALREWEAAKLRDVKALEWAPGGSTLLLITPQQVQVLSTSTLQFGGPLMLHAMGRPYSSLTLGAEVVAVAWHRQLRPAQLVDLPGLALVFCNGLLQMMRDPLDPNPLLVDTELEPTTIGWNPTGTFLAVAGMDKQDREVTVKLYSLTGTLRGQLAFPDSVGGSVTHLAWQGSANRFVAVLGDAVCVVRLEGALRRVPPGVQEALVEPLQLVRSPSLKRQQILSATMTQKTTKQGLILPTDLIPDPLIQLLLRQDLAGSFLTEEQFSLIFAALDPEGHGYITKEDFRALHHHLEKFGLEFEAVKFEQIMEGLQYLGQDLLSYDELAVLLLKLTER
eukprot:GGOE01003717.1.p1 GENE.GGOE01003717.1~~GGOE01003717.1.p1  ORF type:complete len:1057 (+),score=314.82 GGOE01003717.1:37-3207(+)